MTGKLKFNKKELEKLQKQLEELEKGKARDKFFEDCAKEMAARLLSLVVHKTPEGVYDDPKGGALREKIYSRIRYHFFSYSPHRPNEHGLTVP